MKSKTFKFIDLFAGIGGMRLGFEQNGFTCVFTSEWDKFAQKTYEANFGVTPHGDITKIDESEIPSHDVLLAGFPCQPFSSIGKREGFSHETQGTLFYDVVRIIQHHNPHAFLLENVEGLTTHNGGNTFDVIMKTLDELGYQVFWKVLNSADFGVPQIRKRIYLAGFKEGMPGGDFEFPTPHSERVGIGKFIEESVSGYSISKRLQDSYLYKVDDGRPQIVDKSSDFPVKTLVASYHKIQRLTGTFVRGGETGVRLLTENECKAIQGFPQDFRIPVSRTQAYRQFGNSVSVPTISAIARSMKTAMAGTTKARPELTLNHSKNQPTLI
jgi:DNA (cytosine-5)-methyltransferase 1